MDAELRGRVIAVLDAVSSIEMTAGEAADALVPIIAEVEAAAWSASRDAATAEIVALRQSLLMAESWFRDYADQHNAKTPPDTVKAATNAERADYCHKAIDVAIAAGDATAIRAQKEPSA